MLRDRARKRTTNSGRPEWWPSFCGRLLDFEHDGLYGTFKSKWSSTHNHPMIKIQHSPKTVGGLTSIVEYCHRLSKLENKAIGLVIPRFLISWGTKAGLRKTFTPAKWSIINYNCKTNSNVVSRSYFILLHSWNQLNMQHFRKPGKTRENMGKPPSTTATSTHGCSMIKRLRSIQESFWNPYVKHFCSIAADRHPAWICKKEKIQCNNWSKWAPASSCQKTHCVTMARTHASNDLSGP